MHGWSRRQVLAALAGGAAAPMLAQLPGCGAATRGRRGAAAPETESARVLRLLGAAVTGLRGAGHRASGWAQIGSHTLAITDDAGEPVLADSCSASIVLRIAGEHGPVEHVIGDVDEDSVRAATRALSGRTPARGVAPLPALEVERAPRVAIDPRQAARDDHLRRLQPILERSAAFGGSRIVYRAAYLEIDDRDVYFMSGSGDTAAERRVRTRAGIELAAWTGSQLNLQRAERAGSGGLELMKIADETLAAAADEVLSSLTARGAPSGDFELIATPQVAARLALSCVAPAFGGALWARGCRAAELAGQSLFPADLEIFDDPRTAGAFGRYQFDDEGIAARGVALIADGATAGPLCDSASAAALKLEPTGHGRRDELGRLEPRASHVAIRPGERSLAELIAQVEDGLLLADPITAVTDPVTWDLTLETGRAEEIKNGRLTGRRYGRLMTRGAMESVLASVRGIGSAPGVVASRPHAAVAQSASAPALLFRGRVEGTA